MDEFALLQSIIRLRTVTENTIRDLEHGVNQTCYPQVIGNGHYRIGNFLVTDDRLVQNGLADPEVKKVENPVDRINEKG